VAGAVTQVFDTTKFCHKCGQCAVDGESTEPILQLTTFNADTTFGDLGACIGSTANRECFGAGSGDNATTLLSPWCKNCGAAESDQRTVTSKWSAVRADSQSYVSAEAAAAAAAVSARPCLCLTRLCGGWFPRCQVKTPPGVLCLQLKRFNQVWDDYGGASLHRPISVLLRCHRSAC
jgi:hypothetical protein